MKRDRRLLFPIGLLFISMVSLSVQAFIVQDYIFSSIMDQNWETFSKIYGVAAPANGPDVFCFDYCAPELPFIAGWIGIFGLAGSFFSLCFIWIKPKEND